MCAIIGSFDPKKVIELCELNAYRGQASHSITYIDGHGPIAQKKKMGPINYDDILQLEGKDIYIVAHLQAPTGDFHDKYIHPSDIYDCLLWHNGIVKQDEIERLNEKYGTTYEWDTDLINALLYEENTDVLSEIDGSFACLWSDVPNLYAFRNEIAPLFADDDLNVSSTKFENADSLLPNMMYKFKFDERKLYSTGIEFKTKNNPYYFG